MESNTLTKISYNTAELQIQQELAKFNAAVVAIASSCNTQILIRTKSVHSPEFTGDINNPVQLFMKNMPDGIDGLFTYGGGG